MKGNYKKAIRLEENWETFQNEHQEVKIKKDCKGKITRFILPEDYTLILLEFSDDKKKVISLRYLTPDNKYVIFPR